MRTGVFAGVAAALTAQAAKSQLQRRTRNTMYAGPAFDGSVRIGISLQGRNQH
jgi:hypothetical protein